MRHILVIGIAVAALSGCATLTEDAMTPVALSFSDGSNGECKLTNKRGAWLVPMPSTVSVRKSDDALKYDCKTKDGRAALGTIESEMGAKIVASAVFLDFGITDAITDKHRKYAGSFVIPMARAEDPAAAPAQVPAPVAAPVAEPVPAAVPAPAPAAAPAPPEAATPSQ